MSSYCPAGPGLARRSGCLEVPGRLGREGGRAGRPADTCAPHEHVAWMRERGSGVGGARPVFAVLLRSRVGELDARWRGVEFPWCSGASWESLI